MDKQVLVQIKVSEDLKNEAVAVYKSIGLDLSTAVRMFFIKSIDVNGLPFEARKTMPKPFRLEDLTAETFTDEFEKTQRDIRAGRVQSYKEAFSDIRKELDAL